MKIIKCEFGLGFMLIQTRFIYLDGETREPLSIMPPFQTFGSTRSEVKVNKPAKVPRECLGTMNIGLYEFEYNVARLLV